MSDYIETAKNIIAGFSFKEDISILPLSFHYNLIYPQTLVSFILQDPNDFNKLNKKEFVTYKFEFNEKIYNFNSLKCINIFSIVKEINNNNYIKNLPLLALPLAESYLVTDELFFEFRTIVQKNVNFANMRNSLLELLKNTNIYRSIESDWQLIIKILLLINIYRGDFNSYITVNELLKKYNIFPLKFYNDGINIEIFTKLKVLLHSIGYNQKQNKNSEKDIINYCNKIITMFVG